MHVLDAQLNFVKDKTEWNGTDVVFEVTGKGAKPNCALRTPAWFLPSNATVTVQARGLLYHAVCAA